MRRIGAATVMAALLSILNGGCGTLLNVSDKEKVDFGSIDAAAEYVPKYQRPAFPFGGVANDVAWIRTAEQPIDVVESVVDMPFSLVADIVTLPWMTYLWLRNGAK